MKMEISDNVAVGLQVLQECQSTETFGVCGGSGRVRLEGNR